MKKIIAVTLSLLLMLSACSRETEDKVEETKNPYVKTATVDRETYQPVLNFSGSVFASQEANLSSVLPGRVERFLVSAGRQVKKGDLIAELSGELLTQAQLEYETYKKDFGRVSRLYEKGSLPEQKYDHVKAQYEAKKANYELVRKNTQIRAPFAGIVTKKMIQEGESFIVMNPGLEPGYSHASGVVRLMDYSRVKIEIHVSEKDFGLLQPGMSAEITVEAYPEQKWTGKISRLAHTFDTMTKTAEVTIEADNEDLKLKPGMFAKVAIPVQEQQAIFVPLNAIARQPGTGNDYVFTVTNSTVEKKPVERITTKGDRVAVSGLKPGDTIVIEGKSKLRNGAKINVSKQ
ncbi:MAG: efflux RND transporter periplasmic adaptor subunit [Fidelibacterota bacterium]